jgi:hypothetical protein
MPGDAALIGPCQDGVAGQFGAVVADHHFGPAALDDQPVQLPLNGGSADYLALAGTPSSLLRLSSGLRL